MTSTMNPFKWLSLLIPRPIKWNCHQDGAFILFFMFCFLNLITEDQVRRSKRWSLSWWKIMKNDQWKKFWMKELWNRRKCILFSEKICLEESHMTIRRKHKTREENAKRISEISEISKINMRRKKDFYSINLEEITIRTPNLI